MAANPTMEKRLEAETATLLKSMLDMELRRVCQELGFDIALLVGDVSGKGTGAALLMTVLRAAVRGHWAEGTPCEAMARINRTVCQNVPTNKYVTFCMARLDPRAGRLSYVNAGHNAPLLYQAGLAQLVKLIRTGMPLGVEYWSAYEQRSVQLQPGDFVVLYTDGVTDAVNAQEQEFGEERLRRVILENRAAPAADMLAAVVRALEAFTGATAPFDDITLVVARRV